MDLKKLNKKFVIGGKEFSLIQLIVVIVLLGLFLLLIFGISSSFGNKRNNKYEDQKQLAIISATVYFALLADGDGDGKLDYGDSCTEKNGGNKCVCLYTLEQKDYFKSESQINMLNKNDAIIVKDEEYEYVENSSDLCSDIY